MFQMPMCRCFMQHLTMSIPHDIAKARFRLGQRRRFPSVEDHRSRRTDVIFGLFGFVKAHDVSKNSDNEPYIWESAVGLLSP